MRDCLGKLVTLHPYLWREHPIPSVHFGRFSDNSSGGCQNAGRETDEYPSLEFLTVLPHVFSYFGGFGPPRYSLPLVFRIMQQGG